MDDEFMDVGDAVQCRSLVDHEVDHEAAVRGWELAAVASIARKIE
jgi:hypothetical protein